MTCYLVRHGTAAPGPTIGRGPSHRRGGPRSRRRRGRFRPAGRSGRDPPLGSRPRPRDGGDPGCELGAAAGRPRDDGAPTRGRPGGGGGRARPGGDARHGGGAPAAPRAADRGARRRRGGRAASISRRRRPWSSGAAPTAGSSSWSSRRAPGAPLMPRLVCVRCGATAPLGPAFEGCLACPGEPRAALEVVYDYATLAAAGTLKAWASRAGRALAIPRAPAAAAGRDAPDPGGGRDARWSGCREPGPTASG